MGSVSISASQQSRQRSRNFGLNGISRRFAGSVSPLSQYSSPASSRSPLAAKRRITSPVRDRG